VAISRALPSFSTRRSSDLAEFPKLPVLILSVHEEALYATRALRAGAMGYIVKQDAIDNIAAALREALNGRRYLSPVIAAQLQHRSEERTSELQSHLNLVCR